MKIVLTNDDGIFAEGINSLYKILSQKYETYIIAPDRERSACSNSFTVREKLQLKEIEKNKFSLSGYPADCVGMALNGDIIPRVDLVISGINHGPNLGEDTFFSGTVAGARTAFIFGIPAIAISIDSYHEPSKYFDDCSRFLIDFIEDEKSALLSLNNFFNINYPNLPKDKIAGLKYTEIGKRKYNDKYLKENMGDYREVQLEGNILSYGNEGSDGIELEKGFISITPLTVNCTDYSFLNEKNRKDG